MLVVPIYTLSLGLSAGVVGVFVRRLLAGMGYVPGFTSGLLAAAAIACGFAALQLLYVALVRLLKPTHSPVPYVAETLSNAGAALLVPWLLGLELPLPPQVPDKLEVLLFAGAFGAVHGFFKLVSFFGATKATPAERVLSLAWFAACAAAALGCATAAGAWHQALKASHEAALLAEESARVGGATITARRVREKAFASIDLGRRGGRDVLLGWLDPEGGGTPGREVHVTLRPDLPDAAIRQETVTLDGEGWGLLRLGGESLPEGAERCTVMWSAERQPAWVTEMGLRPAEESDRDMLLWGPRFPLPAGRVDRPGFIVVLVEGMGGEQLSLLGYSRQTTPRLDAFAEQAVVFENTYTVAPEGPAVAWSLLTGLSPLAHGALDGQPGTLAEGVQSLAQAFQARGYLTAAFTEGEEPGRPDLPAGSGLAAGFDWYDPSYPTERVRGQLRPGAAGPRRHGGSWRTLSRALAWLEAHREDPVFVLVRLTELRTPEVRGRYGRGYMGQQVNPRPLDVHDTALRHVDEQLGRFFDAVAEMPESEEWTVAVAGTHGLDFTEPGRGTWRRDGPGVAGLSESGLRVPLLLRVPGTLPARRPELVSLESLTPTLEKLAELDLPQSPAGRDLVKYHFAADAVAVAGNPLTAALRSRKWLFTWNTGLDPRTGRQAARPEQGEVFDVERYWGDLAQIPRVARSANLTAAFRERLAAHLGAFYALDEDALAAAGARDEAE